MSRAAPRHTDRASQHAGHSLGSNAANVAPAIPLGIPLANAEPPQEGGDATASETQIETSQGRRCAWHRRQKIARPAHEDRKLTPESL